MVTCEQQVRGAAIWENLGVVESNEMVQAACPDATLVTTIWTYNSHVTGMRSKGRPRTHCVDYNSQMACGHFGISEEKLVEVPWE